MSWQLGAILVLLFFYAVYIGKMIGQRKRGIQTNQMARKKSGTLFYVELFLIIATYAVVVVEVLSIAFHTTAFPPAVRILGLGIALLGDLVFAAAVWTMRDSWRAGISPGEKTEIITSGIYKLSRNPAFLGFDLVYIGILLMFFNWFLLAFTIFSMVMLHLQILQEEKFLPSVFGEDYTKYRRKVGRYFWRL